MNYYYQEKQLYKDSMKHIHDIHGRFMPATSQESNKDHLLSVFLEMKIGKSYSNLVQRQDKIAHYYNQYFDHQ